MKNQPLHGIRVLAGPYCKMVLGELGADLINDELPCVMKRMPGARLGVLPVCQSQQAQSDKNSPCKGEKAGGRLIYAAVVSPIARSMSSLLSNLNSSSPRF